MHMHSGRRPNAEKGHQPQRPFSIKFVTAQLDLDSLELRGLQRFADGMIAARDSFYHRQARRAEGMFPANAGGLKR